MARKGSAPTIDFYKNNSKIKWIVVIISTLISIGSLYYTNVLVSQLKEREKDQVLLFARAIEYTINEDLSTNIVFVSEEIIFKGNSIPTILEDEKGNILHTRNIKIDSTKNQKFIDQQIREEIKSMAETY